MVDDNSLQFRSWLPQSKLLALTAVDLVAWTLTLTAATAVRMSIARGDVMFGRLAWLLLVCAATTVALSLSPQLHHSRQRVGTQEDAKRVLVLWGAVSAVVALTNFVVLGRPVPMSAVMLSLPLALSLMMGARLIWRAVADGLMRPEFVESSTRVIIFGAGEGGAQIVRAMMRDTLSSYVPVALLDDDPERANRSIDGVHVRGSRSDLAEVAEKFEATELLIAIPSANSDVISSIAALGDDAGLEVRVLPPTSELLGLLGVADIRDITDVDLMGRSEVEVDEASIRRYVSGRCVLVTGAGGSIGSELCRQLGSFGLEQLLMLDHDESALHALQLSIDGRALLDSPSLIVADIRDAERMAEVFDRFQPQVIFHAAALKHLTLLEANPSEGVKTNIIGTQNVLEAARAIGVETFVNVSTDKAADPKSVLGGTKLIAERLTARMARQLDADYVSVRFGNVLGSRGSVLPTFQRQIELGGPLTVTDPEATRYFMSVAEAVRLVLQAGAIGRSGETLVLDMGEPVSIGKLAKKLVEHSGRDVAIEVTGLRPGEKQHERLVSTDEVGIVRQHQRISHTSGPADLEVGLSGELILKLDLPSFRPSLA